jgi:hypothetical protein
MGWNPARTNEFNARTQYGENLSTKLYQRMQHSHEQYIQLAREQLYEAIDRNTRDHNRKAHPRQFHEGEWVLLEVKNFENKKTVKNLFGAIHYGISKYK